MNKIMIEQKNFYISSGLTWCIPCVTIAKEKSSSPTSPSAVSGFVRKSSVGTEPGCSIIIKKTDDETSDDKTEPPSKIVIETLEKSPDLTTSRPCLRHSRKKLGHSYDDLISATSNSSAASYGFNEARFKPVLKRPSTVSSGDKPRTTKSGKSGYSTNSLCSNKSVKFMLPEATTASEAAVLPPKPLNLLTSYYGAYYQSTGTTNNVRMFPENSYFFYNNCCANCGMCSLATTSSSSSYQQQQQQRPALNNPAMASNFQIALLKAAEQSLLNYPRQLQSTTTNTTTNDDQPGLIF